MSDFEAEAVVAGLIGWRAFREVAGDYVWIWDGRVAAWYTDERLRDWSEFDLTDIIGRRSTFYEIAVPDWFQGHDEHN